MEDKLERELSKEEKVGQQAPHLAIVENEVEIVVRENGDTRSNAHAAVVTKEAVKYVLDITGMSKSTQGDRSWWR